MEIQESLRRQELVKQIGEMKKKIKSSNVKDVDALIKEFAKLEREFNALNSGVVIEMSETRPGRFRIMRDYTINSESNKKLKRLSR
jgi:hypothetical protein